jgi:hypothetical protein
MVIFESACPTWPITHSTSKRLASRLIEMYVRRSVCWVVRGKGVGALNEGDEVGDPLILRVGSAQPGTHARGVGGIGDGVTLGAHDDDLVHRVAVRDPRVDEVLCCGGLGVVGQA